MIELLLTNLFFIIILMTFAWLIYLWKQNPGVIDVFWSIAISLSGIHYLIAGNSAWNFAKLIILIMLIIWGLRLAGYLLLTRVVPNHVDKRYQDMSNNWKMSKKLGFLINYQFQGILAMIIACPFIFLQNTSSMNFSYIFGMILIIVGLIGECIADYQLQYFKKQVKQRKQDVCNIGLWQYSRHPNYFFESLIWFGFASAALSISYGWLAFISPLLLVSLMLCLTIPITEQGSLSSRGQAYAEYQQRTSKFIPLPRFKSDLNKRTR